SRVRVPFPALGRTLRERRAPLPLVFAQWRRRDGEIGRREGLKIPWGQPHPGSNPGPGTRWSVRTYGISARATSKGAIGREHPKSTHCEALLSSQLVPEHVFIVGAGFSLEANRWRDKRDG